MMRTSHGGTFFDGDCGFLIIKVASESIFDALKDSVRCQVRVQVQLVLEDHVHDALGFGLCKCQDRYYAHLS